MFSDRANIPFLELDVFFSVVLSLQPIRVSVVSQTSRDPHSDEHLSLKLFFALPSTFGSIKAASATRRLIHPPGGLVSANLPPKAEQSSKRQS
jgi:hypothetical protein